jgi:hypothetical protein
MFNKAVNGERISENKTMGIKSTTIEVKAANMSRNNIKEMQSKTVSYSTKDSNKIVPGGGYIQKRKDSDEDLLKNDSLDLEMMVQRKKELRQENSSYATTAIP